MIYADTNFLMACHFQVPGRSERVERFLRRNSQPVIVGELAELEAENRFACECGQADGPQWRCLQARLDAGGWMRDPVAWPVVREKTRELFARYSSRASLGTADVMHLAAAQLAGCTLFASFDTRSRARALALALRLKVFPEATVEDKAGLAILRA